MKRPRKPVTVLMAEDDPDDRALAREALEEAQLPHRLLFVPDGEELMDYLRRHGNYAEPAQSPRPGIILLDLNMPKKDGREVIREMKSDQDLKHIPIVVLTTSKAEEDILRAYDLGVSSFIIKPVTFEALVDIMKTLSKYWFEIVELPPDPTGR